MRNELMSTIEKKITAELSKIAIRHLKSMKKYGRRIFYTSFIFIGIGWQF